MYLWMTWHERHRLFFSNQFAWNLNSINKKELPAVKGQWITGGVKNLLNGQLVGVSFTRAVWILYFIQLLLAISAQPFCTVYVVLVETVLLYNVWSTKCSLIILTAALYLKLLLAGELLMSGNLYKRLRPWNSKTTSA